MQYNILLVSILQKQHNEKAIRSLHIKYCWYVACTIVLALRYNSKALNRNIFSEYRNSCSNMSGHWGSSCRWLSCMQINSLLLYFVDYDEMGCMNTPPIHSNADVMLSVTTRSNPCSISECGILRITSKQTASLKSSVFPAAANSW